LARCRVIGEKVVADFLIHLSMIHILGYLALALNLFSMTRKSILTLRVLSALANAIYVFYGALLVSQPMTIGCSIAVIIHLHKIYQIKADKNLTDLKV